MAYPLQTPSQLPSHLRALRQARGWTQAELGTRLGLSQTRIARIEGAPLSVSVQQLLEVLSALGVRVVLEHVPAPLAMDKAATAARPSAPSPAPAPSSTRAAASQRKRQPEPNW
jgi:HTH-type transcriptional regulator / antitoxin HipB